MNKLKADSDSASLDKYTVGMPSPREGISRLIDSLTFEKVDLVVRSNKSIMKTPSIAREFADKCGSCGSIPRLVRPEALQRGIQMHATMAFRMLPSSCRLGQPLRVRKKCGFFLRRCRGKTMLTCCLLSGIQGDASLQAAMQ